MSSIGKGSYMAKTKMLTLFGKDISKMNHAELKRERLVQADLLTRLKVRSKECSKALDKKYERSGPFAIRREDKDVFYKSYINHVEALIKEIDYWLDRRWESAKDRTWYNTKAQIQAENARRRQNCWNDNLKRWSQAKAQDGLYVSWDKDKFDLIANDRGYQTEEMVLSAVAEELRMSRTNARLAIQGGRFTWGQVLCLGAMLEMTPKEFCDTFLSGYFVDRYGEYRAEYDNLDKNILLKRAVKSEPIPQEPKPKEHKPDPVFEEIYVDSDGRPLGEDTEWFDD